MKRCFTVFPAVLLIGVLFYGNAFLFGSVPAAEAAAGAQSASESAPKNVAGNAPKKATQTRNTNTSSPAGKSVKKTHSRQQKKKQSASKKKSGTKKSAAKTMSPGYTPQPVGPTAAERLQSSLGYTPGHEPGAAQAASLKVDVPDIVWGGEAFPVEIQGQGLQQITLHWLQKDLVVACGRDGQARDSCRAMLPMLLGEKAKELPLAVTLHWPDKQETLRTTLPVGTRPYPEQHLTVEQKYVTPDPSVQERIQEDRRLFREAVGGISSYMYWTLPFKRPVPGTVSSTYGLRRVFNGQPRNPHRGLDFRAAQDDPIAAIEAGRVVLVADQYFGGNTVILDHGLGVFSAYLHMTRWEVSLGQEVQRGETVGYIGSTGRSTGPHLHLSLFVLGNSVDASPLLEPRAPAAQPRAKAKAD